VKVLFLSPPLTTEEVYGIFAKAGAYQPFLGLCYLASVLRKKGHHICIIDPLAKKLTIDDILEELKAFNPHVVGITAATVSYLRAKTLAERVKETFPGMKIIIGGPHLLGFAEETMKEECFDFGVVGEGELTVPELIETLEGGVNGFEQIDGLVFKNKDGRIHRTPPRKYIKDLDTIPFPSRDLLPPLDIYRPAAAYYKRTPVTHMFTSRGCPCQCIFCETPFGKVVRYHSPDYVVGEIEHLIKDFGVREVMINDDTFTVNKDRVYKICELIRKQNLDIIWTCNIRVNTVDKPLLKAMKGAGCWLIMPGLESGSQKILDALKKGTTLEQARNAIAWAHEVGLMTMPSFIIGNPLDTEDTIEETIRFAKSLKTYYPKFTIMIPYPGTPLWNIAEKYGRIDRNGDFSKFILASSEPPFVPHGLTKDVLIQKQREAFRRLYWDPAMIWRHLTSINSLEDIKRLWKGVATILSLQ
jgi:radical SAM superfamily enzyme YgiQ (UPF0313 family)